jgi:hypothetical protein
MEENRINFPRKKEKKKISKKEKKKVERERERAYWCGTRWFVITDKATEMASQCV